MVDPAAGGARSPHWGIVAAHSPGEGDPGKPPAGCEDQPLGAYSHASGAASLAEHPDVDPAGT